MKCEGVTMLKKCGVTAQRPANKRCGTVVESRARFALRLWASSSFKRGEPPPATTAASLCEMLFSIYNVS